MLLFGRRSFQPDILAGKLRPQLLLCEEKGTSPVCIDVWFIYWTLTIFHSALDFPLSYLHVQCLPRDIFSCRVAAVGSHLAGDGQGCWLKDSKRVLGGYLLLTPPGWGLCSELSLELPDLCPLWNYWWLAIFATDLLLISSCSKQQMRGGTKFSVEMHGPEPASNLSPRN